MIKISSTHCEGNGGFKHKGQEKKHQAQGGGDEKDNA